jgi:two-component system response regulator HydG
MREAINRGAISFFLGKPWTSEDLDQMEKNAGASATRRNSKRRGSAAGDARIPEIIGDSAAIRELVALIGNVADTESTVLVTGETGTGKELVGRAIHQLSRRRDRVLCAVNSAAFPETLLESELFGHRKGAFTGAAANTKGLFEQADRGTVFLDEVAEMPLPMQAKLLRFLQTGEVRPVGGDSTREVDVRLVAATNKDLEAEVAAGRFREDLYYRLAVIPLRVPPLRERAEDIPVLAEHFLGRMCLKSGRNLRGIEPEARRLLISYGWPGNVRELENAIERGVALARTSYLQVDDLPRRLRAPDSKRDVPDAIQSLPGLERQHILRTLDRVGWNRKRAAELLQISTTTLWRRLKEFGVDAPHSAASHDESILRG